MAKISTGHGRDLGLEGPRYMTMQWILFCFGIGSDETVQVSWVRWESRANTLIPLSISQLRPTDKMSFQTSLSWQQKSSVKGQPVILQMHFGFCGELTITTYSEFHVSYDPSEGDKIVHAMLVAENGIVFMAAGTPNQMAYQPGASISMSLSPYLIEGRSRDGAKGQLDPSLTAGQ